MSSFGSMGTLTEEDLKDTLGGSSTFLYPQEGGGGLPYQAYRDQVVGLTMGMQTSTGVPVAIMQQTRFLF